MLTQMPPINWENSRYSPEGFRAKTLYGVTLYVDPYNGTLDNPWAWCVVIDDTQHASGVTLTRERAQELAEKAVQKLIEAV